MNGFYNWLIDIFKWQLNKYNIIINDLSNRRVKKIHKNASRPLEWGASEPSYARVRGTLGANKRDEIFKCDNL